MPQQWFLLPAPWGKSNNRKKFLDHIFTYNKCDRALYSQTYVFQDVKLSFDALHNCSHQAYSPAYSNVRRGIPDPRTESTHP